MSDNVTKPNNKLIVIGVLIAFLYYPVAGSFLYWGRGYDVATLFSSRLIIWLEVLLLYFYSRNIEKVKFLLWPERTHKFWFYPASLFGLYISAFGAGILANIPKLLGWHDDYSLIVLMNVILSKNMPLLIFAALTAGITEELIVRAYILPRLELLFKNKAASIVVSALMFAAIHFRYFNLYEVIFAFLIGVIFAVHYQIYRNIKILIFTHACIDLVSFLLFRFLNGICPI